MVSLSEQLERTRFHDSELGRCISDGDTLHLHFRNILLNWDEEEYYSAHVTFNGVKEIRRFEEKIQEMTLESQSSDVLQFHRGNGTALLLIEWGFYQPTASVYAEYRIDYVSSDITAEKQDELIV